MTFLIFPGKTLSATTTEMQRAALPLHDKVLTTARIARIYEVLTGLVDKPGKTFAFPLVKNNIIDWNQPMSDHKFYNNMRRRLSRLGLPDSDVSRFTTHSFRSGGVTDYLLAGVPAWYIQQQGRWASNSFMIYYRISQVTLHARAK